VTAYIFQCPSSRKPGWVGLSLPSYSTRDKAAWNKADGTRNPAARQGQDSLFMSSPSPLVYALEKPGITFVTVTTAVTMGGLLGPLKQG